MKSLKNFAGIGLITILAASVTVAGTIPGSRNGTIVGGRNGTIVGGRNGTIVGGRNGIIPTSTNQQLPSKIQVEFLSGLLLYMTLLW